MCRRTDKDDEEFKQFLEQEMDEMRRAHTAAEMADQQEFDQAVDEFFDKAFEMAEGGQIPLNQLQQFFPRAH